MDRSSLVKLCPTHSSVHDFTFPIAHVTTDLPLALETGSIIIIFRVYLQLWPQWINSSMLNKNYPLKSWKGSYHRPHSKKPHLPHYNTIGYNLIFKCIWNYSIPAPASNSKRQLLTPFGGGPGKTGTKFTAPVSEAERVWRHRPAWITARSCRSSQEA